MPFTLKSLVCVALFTALISHADAATIKWSNPAGGNFSTAANWSPPSVPGSGDIAVINLNGTYTVTVDAAVTLGGLCVGGTSGTQTLSVSAAVLTLNGTGLIDKNGVLAIGGATLTFNSASISLENLGTINWSGGTISIGFVDNIGTFNIQPGAAAKVADGLSIGNSGTLNWSGDSPQADFDLKTSANIFSTGLIDITGNATATSSTADGVVTDLGLMRKSAGATTTTFSNVIFGNYQVPQGDGVLEVDTGILLFTKPINALSGNTLNHGKYVVKGSLRVKSANITSFTSASVTLDGSGAIQDDSGLPGMPNLNLIDSNSALTLSNSASLTTGASFTNGGKLVVANSTLTASTFTQNPSSATVLNSGTIVAATFDNYTGGGTLSGSGTLSGNVTNTGTISLGSLPATTGTLTITGSFDNSSGGTVNLKVGGTSGGQFDALAVGSGSTVGGTVNTIMINGYHPANNDQITIISGALTSGFSGVNFCGAACITAIQPNNNDVKFTTDIQATWTGAVNTVWGNSGNWSPPSIPNSSSTNVRIPNTANIPVLDASYACKDLLVDAGPGSRLNLSTFTLSVNGNLQTSGAIAAGAGGTLDLTGANVTFETIGANGSIPNATVTGLYYAANAGSSVFSSNLDVSGLLILNGGTVTVNGNYSQSAGSGVMQMFYPTDHLIVLGNVNFNGASELGFLTAGLLEIQGALTSGGSSRFGAFSPHTTRFTGPSSTASPGTGDSFGRLEVGTAATAANLEFDTVSSISGDAVITKGVVTTNPNTVTVSIGGNLLDPPGGNWRAANTTFTSFTPLLPPTLQSNVTFNAPPGHVVNPPLGFTITGANNLIVSNGTFDIGANLIVVGNDFMTTGQGVLQMISQSGELSVLRDVNFTADSGVGTMIGGRLRVKRNFTTVAGEGPVLGADLVHVVTFDGTTPQTITLGNPGPDDAFQNLEINGASTSVSIITHCTCNGGLKLLNGALTLAASQVLTLNGDGYAQATGTLLLNSTSQITSSAPLKLVGGTISGVGSIFGTLTNFGGTVAPGLSGSGNEGGLNITNYTQMSGGSLTLRISSLSTFDKLFGNAFNLSGTLNITLDGYAGVLSDSFAVINGSTVSGTFTTVNGRSINATLGFDTQYSAMNLNLVVLQKPQITNAVLTSTGQVGQVFSSYTVTTTGSPTIVVSSTPLPNGLTLSGNVIMGTPLAGGEGVTSVTLTATNNVGVDTKTLTLTINRIPVFTSAASTSSLIGAPFNFVFTAAGFPAPTIATTSTLPPGLTLTGTTLSGTPTLAGATTLALTATNAVGMGTQNFQITITTSGPPVLVSVGSTPNPQQTGVNATFTAVATQPDGAGLTFSWDFKDGTAPVSGNPVQHMFTIENLYPVTVTVTDGSNVVTGTVSHQALAPSSGGGGVPNIGQNDTPVPDPFSGITLAVVQSDGGVLTFGIDINALLRDQFSVGTDFQSISGRSDTVSGTTVVHKFTDPGVYVATSTATETATQLKKGKARKTVALSALETGTPPKFTHKPLKNNITGVAIKGNFQFNRNGDGDSASTLALPALTAFAAAAKPDLVTMSGSIELPEGLDISQSQDFSFGIGNIIDQVTVTSKGKAVLPSALKRIKSLTIKYPKLAKGSTLTTAGQSAKFTISISQSGLSAAGFDTEGVTGTLKTGETAKSTLTRTVQVAMAFAGEVWEVQAPVQFKLAANGGSGSISGRSGN